MLKTKTTIFLSGLLAFCLLQMFSSCATSSGAVSNGSSGGGSFGGGSREPSWVSDPYSKFENQRYHATVGAGSSREAAEKNALANLVSSFDLNISVDDKSSVFYQEAKKNGVTANWSETTTIDNSTKITAGMDSLVGAEIGEVWFDGRNTYHAVALLNKSKAVQTYSEMIKSNQGIIDNLTNIPAAEKNSIEGFARYHYAATIADVNISYGKLLSVIGAPSYAQGLKSGDSYRIEADGIARQIPITVTVKNDRDGRVQAAFVKALADLKFLSGGNVSRYRLTVDVAVSPVDLPNPNNYIYADIVVNAKINDTKNNSDFAPYSFKSREGHTTQDRANERAYAAAVNDINSKYSSILSGYITKLLAK